MKTHSYMYVVYLNRTSSFLFNLFFVLFFVEKKKVRRGGGGRGKVSVCVYKMCSFLIKINFIIFYFFFFFFFFETENMY